MNDAEKIALEIAASYYGQEHFTDISSTVVVELTAYIATAIAPLVQELGHAEMMVGAYKLERDELKSKLVEVERHKDLILDDEKQFVKTQDELWKAGETCAELRAQLEKAKQALGVLIDFASTKVRSEMRPTMGPIDGPGVIYVGRRPDDFEAIHKAKATLAELSAILANR